MEKPKKYTSIISSSLFIGLFCCVIFTFIFLGRTVYYDSQIKERSARILAKPTIILCRYDDKKDWKRFDGTNVSINQYSLSFDELDSGKTTFIYSTQCILQEK